MSKKIAKALIGGNWLATLPTQLKKFEVFYFLIFFINSFLFFGQGNAMELLHQLRA
jgi:hypothetical protein